MRRILGWLYRRLTPGRTAAFVFVTLAAVLWWQLPQQPVGVITTNEQQLILALSPDGRTLATGTLHVWYGNSGGWEFEPCGVGWPITEVSVWDVDTGRLRCRHAVPGRDPAGRVRNEPMTGQCWFTADGNLFFRRQGWGVNPLNGAALVLDPRDGQTHVLFESSPQKGTIGGACLPACGNRAVVIVCHAPQDAEGEHPTIYVTDATTGERHKVASMANIFFPTVSPNGRLFAVITTDPAAPSENVIGVWDLEAHGRFHRFLRAPDLPEGALCWISPDERYLIAASPDQALRLWDVASGQLLGKVAAEDTSAPSGWFTADHGFCAEGNKSVVCYDVPSLVVRWRHELAEHTAAVPSPDRDLFTLTDSVPVGIFDARGGNALTGGYECLPGWDREARLDESSFVPARGLYAVKWTTWRPRNAVLSRIGRALRVQGLDGDGTETEVLLFDPRTGRIANRVPSGADSYPLVFNPDGRFLAASGPLATDFWGRPDPTGPHTILVWATEPGRPWAVILTWATAAAALVYLPWRAAGFIRVVQRRRAAGVQSAPVTPKRA